MPLSQNEILILAALGTRDMYGREITDEIERLTNGRYRISLGGLYTTLHRMEKKKLISGRWGDARTENAEARRRFYRVTALGHRALHETQRTLASALRLRLGEA